MRSLIRVSGVLVGLVFLFAPRCEAESAPPAQSMAEAAKGAQSSPVSNNLVEFKPLKTDQDATGGNWIPRISFGTETLASPHIYVLSNGGMKYSETDNTLRPLFLSDTGMVYTADADGKNSREVTDASIRRNFAWFLLERAPLQAPPVKAFFSRYYEVDSESLASFKATAAKNGEKGTHGGEGSGERVTGMSDTQKLRALLSEPQAWTKKCQGKTCTFEHKTHGVLTASKGLADLLDAKAAASSNAGPVQAKQLSEKQKEMLAEYLKKKDKLDPHSRYAKEQELLRQNALEKPEDILSAADKAFIELMKERGFKSVQGTLDPKICSASKLYSNYMARDLSHYPTGGAHYGFGSNWVYDQTTYPSRSSVAGGMEISATSLSGFGDAEAMARKYWKKPYKELTDFEKLKAHAQACLDQWQFNQAGPTHWNTANSAY